jgi:EmrB/QacA subfamily drug resistance transporter
MRGTWKRRNGDAAMAQPYAEPCSRGIIAAEPCEAETERRVSPGRRRIVLAACVLASSMAFIDSSALTVALPALRADFDAGLAALHWVLNGYVLALAALTLIGGAVADTYGKARMLAIGCVLFALASLACALAPTIGWLVGARVVQGVGAALLTPASLSLIGAVYPERARNRAIAVWASASALTTAGGPVLGGWLTSTFGWRAVFWINPPLAVAVVALLIAAAPSLRRQARRFDAPGAAILALALAAIAWALSEIGAAEGTGASRVAIVAAAALGGLGLVGYALWERASDHPMTPPRLAANRPFLGLNIATFLIYGGLSIALFLLPFDLVERRALSPTTVGLAFLPFTLGVGVLSRPFGALADRMGAGLLLMIGAAAAALSYVWLALAREAPLAVGVLAPMGLLGVAFAVIAAPITAAVLSSIERSDEGLASGVNNAASRVAQLAGVALAAGVAPFAAGQALGLAAAAVVSLGGAVAVAVTLRDPRKSA